MKEEHKKTNMNHCHNGCHTLTLSLFSHTEGSGQEKTQEQDVKKKRQNESNNEEAYQWPGPQSTLNTRKQAFLSVPLSEVSSSLSHSFGVTGNSSSIIHSFIPFTASLDLNVLFLPFSFCSLCVLFNSFFLLL